MGYYFGEDQEAEKRRLSAVEAHSDPASRSLLRELGVGAGWACWEVGAGRGSLAYWLADLVGPRGRVLATDIDVSELQSRPNLAVVRHDVVEDDPPEDRFDLIHARFLLEHLPEPDQVLRRCASVLRPGGLLVVEDSDGLGLLVDPDVAEVVPICRAWESVASSLSWNPTLGGDLVSALKGCGLAGVEGATYRRKASGGPIWEPVKLGLIRLQDRIIEAGANREALSLVLGVLDDSAYTISGPPVAIAWGANGP